MQQDNKRGACGVFLLYMGGPERPDEVRPFLTNLFSDRRIIRLGPAWMQPFLARFIAWRRAPRSVGHYARMNGAPSLLACTNQQARALEALLAQHGSYIVRPCMRYWRPFAHEALGELLALGITRAVLLPLYPHYSKATTGSSFASFERAKNAIQPTLPSRLIRTWPDQENYIEALAGRVHEGMAFFPHGRTRLLYSAHSLPKRFIDEGDPYVDELRKTIFALEKKTGIAGRLCFQSKSGPAAWLEPTTPEAIRQAAREDAQNVLILPISFVSDHLETVVELNMDCRTLARDLGLRFALTRALNDDPLFIEALAALVLAADGGAGPE